MLSAIAGFRCYDVQSLECYAVPPCNCEELDGKLLDEKEVSQHHVYRNAADISTGDDVDAAAFLFDAITPSGAGSRFPGVNFSSTVPLPNSTPPMVSKKPQKALGEARRIDGNPQDDEHTTEEPELDHKQHSVTSFNPDSLKAVGNGASLEGPRQPPVGSPEGRQAARSASRAALDTMPTVPAEGTPATFHTSPKKQLDVGSPEEELLSPADLADSPFIDNSNSNPFYDRFQGFHEVGSLDDDINI
mmetsp:Transcript_37467/g.79476  ORF Transcript_37467/g.79476 Transcript_37467/m.79476 type:complete len:246 (-) Transcript_37467:229-966(-)